MPHIAANLPTPDKEIKGRHPLIGAQPRLPREVVEVCDQPLHEILEARIAALRVDTDRVRRDVVDREIQKFRCVFGRHY